MGKLKKKTAKIGSKKKKNSLYFGKEAHEAIVKYQSTDCKHKKNKIKSHGIAASKLVPVRTWRAIEAP